jgi:hypothetical protein
VDEMQWLKQNPRDEKNIDILNDLDAIIEQFYPSMMKE